MSLLLSSLKKADQENQKAADEQTAAAAAESTQTPAGAATPVAPAVAAPVAPIGVAPSATPSAPVGGTVDFDSIQDDSASDAGGATHDAAVAEYKDLVSASRVFRAGGEQEDSEGGGSKIYVVIALVIFIGGGAGLVTSGLIPGVSTSSLLGIFDDKRAVVKTDDADDIPILAVAGDSEALSLPQPLVDIQSDVEFAGLQVPGDNSLDTPEGRREYAKKIAILTGTTSDEEYDDDFFGENDADELLGLAVEEPLGAATIEEDAEGEISDVVKTAAVSREKRRSLDLRTPSDRAISRGVKINSGGEEIVVAQSSSAEDDSSSTAQEEVKADDAINSVSPSLSGVDRQRMLGEADRFYIDGSYANAEALYRNVLAKNPTNPDALRGLALVAVATGRYQAAAVTYLKILEYYPNDPVAIADLTNLHGGVSGGKFYEIESALKKVIGQRPESDARIYFTLGNLYAENSRWLDAQQSYFKAYSAEQTNPDYAYNLAVVLDYLNKPKLAVNYYREALELAKNMPSGFNAGQVNARINDILK